MSDEDGSKGGGGPGSQRKIHQRKVAPEVEKANRSLLRLIANLENCEVTDLPPLYESIDHMVEHLFSNPPSIEAQAQLEFSYHGYRINLDQDGNVSLMKLAEEPVPENGEEETK